jgi:hypothetical protein
MRRGGRSDLPHRTHQSRRSPLPLRAPSQEPTRAGDFRLDRSRRWLEPRSSLAELAHQRLHRYRRLRPRRVSNVTRRLLQPSSRQTAVLKPRGLSVPCVPAREPLNNWRLEGLNSRIRLIGRRSFGFHSASSLIALSSTSAAPASRSPSRDELSPQKAAGAPFLCCPVVVCAQASH